MKRMQAKWLVLCLAIGAGCIGGADGMEALTADDTPDEEVGATPAKPTTPPPPKLAPPPAESPAAKFVGTYRWVGGLPEQRLLWQKIEGIASNFNFIAKPIVRDKLAEGNQIAKEIRIESDGVNLLVRTDDKEAQAPLDGSTVKHKATNGEMMDMKFEVGDEIVQSFQGNAKSRENRYRLEGDRLTFQVKIRASQLPKELVYELTYERVGDEEVPRR
jgi:hypothetical protein